MSARATLLQELETSIRDGSPNQRITTLRRVTDLFIRGAEQYDDEQVRLFDEVIGRLATEIEKTALAELAHRLAPVPSAPRGVIRTLAADHRIAVAGPVLAGSRIRAQQGPGAFARHQSPLPPERGRDGHIG
jgi:uncharacterized protein (DUF2336 family)